MTSGANSLEHSVSRALAEYKEKVKLKNDNKFDKTLYDEALTVISNRIATQHGNVPNESLLDHTNELFQSVLPSNSPLLTYSRDVFNEKRRDDCILEVTVDCAENLAPKDVTGLSDPFCILGVVEKDSYINLHSEKRIKYCQVTSVVEQNLNPEWRQTFRLRVKSSKVNQLHLHAHVWDYDDSSRSVTSTMSKVKDVKGIRGAGRFV